MDTSGSVSNDVVRVTQRFGDAGIRLGLPGSDADIIMTPAAYPYFLAGGELDIGESYQDGFWFEGRMGVDEFTKRRVHSRLYGPPGMTDPSQQSIENATRVAHRHYDLGNDYFRAILDPYMQYSCAWWHKGAKNLAEAQRHKMEGIGLKMCLKPGDSVLDIGCGFGGLLRFLHEQCGIQGVGVTISKEQAALAREHTKDLPIRIRVLDYRKLEGQFDHIVSVGMFEHVGPAHYGEFFETCKRLLKPGGDLLLHSIFGGGMNPWLERYIFPGGELPVKKQVEEAIEGLFVPMDWHWFGRGYDPTLVAWDRNMHTARVELEAAGHGDHFFRTQHYYQLLCAGLFRSRVITVGQVHLFGEYIPDYEQVR